MLFSGAHIHDHAFVESSVILPGAVTGRDCRLRGVILDSDGRVPDGAVIQSARRGQEREEPVVITAEDLATDLVDRCA